MKQELRVNEITESLLDSDVIKDNQHSFQGSELNSMSSFTVSQSANDDSPSDIRKNISIKATSGTVASSSNTLQVIEENVHDS
jgi:hypothetical protein